MLQIKDGKIAAVAANIEASRAAKTVDANGLYVTPGLIDIHVHVYPGLTRNSYAAGSWGLQPDGFTLRVGVTTVADAGSAGWRTFEDFKTRIIDAQKTRVLSFINIVGAGMGSGRIEQNLDDMDVSGHEGPRKAMLDGRKRGVILMSAMAEAASCGAARSR